MPQRPSSLQNVSPTVRENWSISLVDYDPVSEKEQKNLMVDTQRFMKYAPHFSGLATPAESVALVRKVIENSSIENGDGGTYVFQFGDKQWQ